MTRVLAFDLSRKGCGWSGDGDKPGVPVSGTQRLPKIEGNPREGYDFGPTFAAFWLFAREKIKDFEPDLIAYEAPLMPRPREDGNRQNFVTTEETVRALFGLATLAETIATLSGIKVFEANIQTVKKHFAGHGHADKSEIEARCRQLGWPVVDHNAADACAVWSLAKCIHDPGFSYSTTPMFAGARA
jgi:Holliday junction resolvasome RuvABC endonuclease subunit